jgi:hypothetical protein
MKIEIWDTVLKHYRAFGEPAMSPREEMLQRRVPCPHCGKVIVGSGKLHVCPAFPLGIISDDFLLSQPFSAPVSLIGVP